MTSRPSLKTTKTFLCFERPMLWQCMTWAPQIGALFLTKGTRKYSATICETHVPPDFGCSVTMYRGKWFAKCLIISWRLKALNFKLSRFCLFSFFFSLDCCTGVFPLHRLCKQTVAIHTIELSEIPIAVRIDRIQSPGSQPFTWRPKSRSTYSTVGRNSSVRTCLALELIGG